MLQRLGAWIGLILALASPVPALAATVAPASVAFGGQSMATTSPVQTVTLTNDGAGAITVSAVTVSNAQFAQNHNCATLAAGASCTVSVTFTPAIAAGALNSTSPVSGNLTITHNGAGSPHAVPLAGTAEKSLVTHYYRSILRRAPDAGGKAFWEAEAARMQSVGVNVNEAWFSMAMQFYSSPEYLALNRTPTGFVTDLFNTFFNRVPDGGGLSFWTGEMSQGMPREIVLASFMFSSEFTTFAQAIFGNTAARAEVDVVIDFFRGLLARLPDNGGFDYWVGQFRTAQCTGSSAVTAAVETISSSFTTSAEYTVRNRTNTQYVGDLYNAFLRRGGDLGGVNYWVNQLNSGAMSRSALRQTFIASAEFNGRVNAVLAQGCLGRIYYLSPGPLGSDGNSGSEASPWKTFAKAFGAMVAADELVLLNGTYSVAAGTGIISYLGTGSAQPKSGLNLSSMTVVRAKNPGQVTVDGALFLGRSNRKDSFIRIHGITFTGGLHSLYNTSFITVKECGFNGGFNIGSNDHNAFNDNNLVEDVWIWASGQRGIAVNYRSHFNVWRRVVVRGDGCGTTECANSPNIGITVYDSSDITLQNVVVVDRILAPTDSGYADFAVAQHTADVRYYAGRNEWLGTISLGAPDQGYYQEPDQGQTVSPTSTLRNAIAWGANGDGFNIARSGTNYLLENLSANSVGTVTNGIRVAPEMTTGTLRNVLVTGTGKFGINSKFPPTFADVFFTPVNGSVYNQTACSGTCFTTNPRADTPGPSQRYITRIEAGSKLKGAGSGGADIGANVVFRYGADGARFGDPSYNTLSTTPLWPWPNEARIKAQMCATTTRGFCSTAKRLDGVNDVTLTSYVWEYLGNPIPAGIYP